MYQLLKKCAILLMKVEEDVMNEEMNNNIVNNETNSSNNYEPPKSNNGVKVLLIILIILVLCLIGLTTYKMLVLDKKNDNKQNNNVVDNKDNNKYLKLSDFPYADDNADKDYIKNKGAFFILELNNYSNDSNIQWNGKWVLKSNNDEVDPGFLNINKKIKLNNNVVFNMTCVDIEAVRGPGYTNSECYGAELLIQSEKDYRNQARVYFEGSINPYIITTDKYVIILNNADTIDSNNFIYIYDYNFNQVKIIKNVSYKITDYDYRNDGLMNNDTLLNGSTNIAIANNVLYYVTSLDNTTMVLECIDLNEEKLNNIVIEKFNYNEKINRNKNITSINQAPFTQNYQTKPLTIGKHKVSFDNDNDKIVVDTKNSYNYVSWYINPNGYGMDLLGDNESVQILDNCIYYIKDNKNNTLSLMKIDLSNDEIKESVIDTFNKILKLD